MMPRKPDAKKRKPTGVSIEATLLERAKKYAEREGYPSLSALVVSLLREAIQQASDSTEKAGRSKIAKAQGKLRRR